MKSSQAHSVWILVSFLTTLPLATKSFTAPPFGCCTALQKQGHARYVSSTNDPPSTVVADSNDDDMNDKELLRTTLREQFVSLCRQFGISDEGTKEVLLQRLRTHAEEEAKKEQARLLSRKRRVEEGSDNDRERFEILGDAEDEEESAFFYYYDASVAVNKTSNDSHGADTRKQPRNQQGYVTVPPPPPVEPNANGERVVTVYSTSEQNDLTGVAASQPGQAAAMDPMTSAMVEPESAPWDTNNPQKRDTSSGEMERAEEQVTELVKNLLAMTGLPAFQQDDDDVDEQLTSLGVVRRRSSNAAPDAFADFDPAAVPTDMLTKASKSLRTSRGKVLMGVLRKFELNAIGHDGAFGDNVEKGGGHYKQVSRVRSFLEGFRRAEVRRLSRETATLLLDKLVSEGIEGLDIALASMIRSDDDTSEEGGELNDSLLDYLNDAIRTQEKKTEQIIDSIKKRAELETAVAGKDDEDRLEGLWTVDSDGVETFDPSKPENKRLLQEEYEKSIGNEITAGSMVPQSAPEKLLLLLKLLRERVKTEAAFSNDEKSRNLRVLAYSLNLNSDNQRRELLLKEFGASLDRLDSFAELVASSIEYGESTSHQLQPSKRGSLDVKLLKRIHSLTQEVKEKQSWKASGAKTNTLSP
eukprot:CAMPEP_0117014768 /NCGR_PEP_ID=MMETSP0472-20121206/11918_1 /TAXON_ID=693140 ORGANISM="Tiarina fusus, Strain LIS" /NCGR_SAMPLE_ID=MMETSP0472 /ASSEMBLY_ACC=CAM_ASM_000603 /LENGTH=639 /DNA_ID=CAMNT_0004718407 /DNA_START=153 /DNA_END=2072 /DNA_ORIENTATION=-